MRHALRFLPQLASAITLAVVLSSPAPAATIAVDTLEDRIDRRVCSLRAAVEAAHIDRYVGGCKAGAPGADTIVFRRGLTGTIRLESQLAIESSLSIEGPGADRLAIAGAVPLIRAGGTATVEFSGLQMNTGLFIIAAESVHIRSVLFKSIRSQMSRASAIQVQGNRSYPIGGITISNSSFHGNEGADSPLAVVGETRRLALHDIDFFGNRGDLAGAILLEDAGPIEVEIVDGRFFGNQAPYGFAGAIAALGKARLQVTRGKFRLNESSQSGALFIAADRLQVENSVFHRNGSANTGAIHIEQLTGATGESQLLFSTLVDNDSAGWGPALVNRAGNVLWLGGNLMRPGNAYATCQSQGLASMGYNLELGTNSCLLHGPGDHDNVQMTLYRTDGGTGQYLLPVPDPSHYFAVDVIPDYACSDLYGQPVSEDGVGRTRPVDFSTGQPGYYCDVGAVELRASDPLFPLP